MKKPKNITSIIMAATLALTMPGCTSPAAVPSSSSSSSAAEEIKENIVNRDEFGVVYTMTAVFSVPVPETEKRETNTTSAFTYADITDCGKLETFNEKYTIPAISGEKDIEYFSPIICDKEITAVKYTEEPGDTGSSGTENEQVSSVTIKVGDSSVPGFLLKSTGTYELTIGEETLEVKVKDSSLYLDKINEMEVPGILINTDSDDFKERGKEYDITVPALVKSYMEKFKDEDKTLAALKMDNAVFLKEYNRIRLLRGQEVLSAEDMLSAYKNTKVDQRKVISSPNRRGLKEKIAVLRGIKLTPEEKNNTAPSGSANTGTGKTPAGRSSASASGNTSGNASGNTGAAVSGGGASGSDALSLINSYRASNGLPPLSWGDGGAASIRASELISNFSHGSASGQNCYGENICMEATGTAGNAVNQWINSPPHRANLLDPVCTKCAVAVAKSGGWYYWVMMLWK